MTIAVAHSPRQSAPARPSVRARVLLVDDDERNLLALSQVLEPVAEVVTVTSGRAALRELMSEEFAVILLDVFMPDLDGYETAALVRNRPQTARIPIIFLSAVNKETEHLIRGYSMGAVDYVFKPVDPVVLKSKVAVFVDLFELRQQIAGQALAEQELRETALKAEAERLVYERELQQAQIRQAAILQALPLAMYEATADTDGQLTRTFVGGDLEKIAGPDAEALETRSLSWDSRINPDDAKRLEQTICSCTDATVASQYRWLRSDGTTIYVIDQCVRSPDRTDAWVGTLIDVTPQRELEQQLVQSRKSEALGQLTGGIAHDFNNLLAAVLGGLRLLEARVDFGEREQRIVDQMRHAAESGAELVRRLMTFARRQELSPSPIGPADLRDAVSGLVEHTLGSGVTLDWRLKDCGLHLFADPGLLELSLVNLLINARDAMPDGGKVVVDIARVADGERKHLPESTGDYLRIRVSDEGAGIPADLIERVTEPFFTTKEAGKGTGLGLSMVAGFVQQSGGKFQIESKVGLGTQIDLLLPALSPPEKSPPAQDTARSRRQFVNSVLLVDDDESVRLIVGEQISELGIDLTVTESAEQALTILEKQKSAPDFILTDLSMPGMDGASLLEKVRERWPSIRGAIMTGNPLPDLKKSRRNVRVIHKPLAAGELETILAVPARAESG